MIIGNSPIITSLLDNDWYQFKMAEFFKRTANHTIQVTYKLFNRASIKLANRIDRCRLNEEISNLLKLRLSFSESSYLINNGISEDTVDFININLSNVILNITTTNDELDITYTGPIGAAILYETPLMAIINELYNLNVITTVLKDDAEEAMMAEIKNRTRDKAKIISDIDIKFAEFGTRRRFSKRHQKWVVEYLSQKINRYRDKFIGTSNVLLAKEFDIQAIGTMAHQVPMFYAARGLQTRPKHIDVDTQFKRSQINAINDWITVFNEEVFWLTDTYTTNWFIRNIPSNISDKLMYRQDSGNPFIIANEISKYCSESRDNKTKIMFSDSLNLTLIQRLYHEFNDKFDVYFGWGTNLTNDTLIKPLNIVVKLYSVENEFTCKLSDDEGKVIGETASLYKTIARP